MTSLSFAKQIVNVPVSGAHRPGREGRPSWTRASADSGADRSHSRSSNHASGAFGTNRQEACGCPGVRDFGKGCPVAKLLLQHEIISREGRFQGVFLGRLRNRRSVFLLLVFSSRKKGELKAGTERRPRAPTERRTCEPRRTR